MLRVCGGLFRTNANVLRNYTQLSKFHKIIISDEVRTALKENKAVVALESTIITHGMPYPENIKCALEVEAEVRQQGAVPATVAVIQGQIRVGLGENELRQLGNVVESQPIKTSRRDLAYVVSTGRNGGTTVSGTLIVANRVGIPVFATGGIGGVHRSGETTFDVSADLTELGRSNVAVVSSGIKSILDIPKTLEYLETQGVFVATFGAGRDFPAFYSRRSGCQAPYSVQTATEAAKIISSNHNLNLQSGMLFAVPVPEKFALDEKVIDGVIEEALEDAKRKGIAGKEITPFLLGRIGEITAGKSLETNMELIKNNARTAACIASELSALKKLNAGQPFENKSCKIKKPVVVGGSNLECSIKLATDEIKLDGRIHFGNSVTSGGGVARNICEALSKLECPPEFISVLGDDPGGRILKDLIPNENVNRVKILRGRNTAQCIVVFDQTGECKFLAGDMEIHRSITPEMILEHEHVIREAPLIVFDANLSIPTIETLLKLAERYNVPVVFEPTDVDVSSKPFQTKHWSAIKFITPNLNELKHIAAHFQIQENSSLNELDGVVDIARRLVDYVDNVIVTLGADGVVVARRGQANEPFLNSTNKLGIRHYPIPKVGPVVNVSGAGDSLASGLIAGVINGLSEEECLSVALAAAETALTSDRPVANRLFGKDHLAWRSRATYNSLIRD